MTLLPLTPLQSMPARQSELVLQTRTQVVPAPVTLSQMEPSGQPAVVPVVVQATVQ